VRIGTQKSISLIVIIFYIAIRIRSIILADPIFDLYDSPAYFIFTIYPTVRLQGVTSVYSILESYNAIIIFQSVIGTCSTILLWFALSKLFKREFEKLVFTFSYFILFISSVVVEHDAVLLSESLSISSLQILIGAFVLNWTSNFNSSYGILGLILSVIFFVSTKNSHSLIIPILIPILIIVIFRFNKFRIFYKYLYSILAVGAITFFFIAGQSTKDFETLSTNAIINNRLWESPDWRQQVIQSGYSEGLHEIWLTHKNFDLGSPPDQAVADNLEFQKWWREGGDNFLIKFGIDNPAYSLIGPIFLPLLDSSQNYRKTLLSGWSQGTDYSRIYPELSKTNLVRTFFWPDEPEKAYLVLSIMLILIGFSLILNFFNRNKSNSWLLIAFVTFIFLSSFPNWWFGSKPGDMARHNLESAIMWRVTGLLAALFLLAELRSMLTKKFK
jgi:hypothetical protein